MFARPAGCNKVFTGRCVYKDDFASALGPTRYDPATLVVVAAPREMGRERRLVAAGDHVIAASQYAPGGASAPSRAAPTRYVRSLRQC